MPNHLNVVTVPYESPGIVSFYIVVRVGSREEVEPGKTGFAHFFEHIMFRGTDKYPKEAYDAALKSTGASANANTFLDRTVYHMTGNKDLLEKMFEVESDRFMHLHYSEADFKTEAGAVKGEYTKNFSDPFEQLEEKTDQAAFDKHTYKHTTMGFWEDVVNMPNQYDYSLTFFDRFYRPEYSTILVIGDAMPEQVNMLAEKYFGDWKTGNYVPQIPVEPDQKQTRYAHVKAPNFPPYIQLNYKSPAFSIKTKDCAALEVIGQLLFSERSDLYKKLVIQERKCRYIRSSYFFTKDPFLYGAGASLFQASDMQYVKDEIMKAIENIKSNPVDQKLLDETKSHIRYDFSMGLNSSSSIAEMLSYSIWISGDPESIGILYSQVNHLSPDDIREAASKYFLPEKLTISTISPDDNGGVR